MPGALPDGEPVPADGTLPEQARRGLGERPFGIYVHVPFCTTRCGYCDFNTYTAAELGGGTSLGSYPALALAEIGFARKVLGAADVPVRTVFFGGGTPTLMPPAAFGRILRAIDAEFGLAPGAEITTEANPESVDEATLSELRAQGVNRVSFGMQSAVPGVLAVLDRVHQPGRPARCAEWARAAGFEHVSLDLIYGTPGETDADWRRSLEAAVAAGPDHVSAYALTVEAGTRLAARVRRGELPAPDDDVLADRYLIADEALSAAGLGWYEISNWARGPSSRCAHNMLYWTGGDWWGIGPGAHSHVGGTRWWNVRHPAAYAARIGAGLSPGQAREVLAGAEQRLERVMLLIRLADGCPVEVLSPAGRAATAAVVAEGLARRDAYAAGRIVLTSRGRLLADTVTRMLSDLFRVWRSARRSRRVPRTSVRRGWPRRARGSGTSAPRARSRTRPGSSPPGPW
jgi:putative oxygen-independent coproporphyrinogen III oxidase